MSKPMNLRNAIAQAKIEILRRMEDGQIPENVECFGDLHDHIDANCLIGLCEDNPRYEGLWLEHTPECTDQSCAPFTPAGYAFVDNMQEAVDAWLRERTASFPADPDVLWDEGENVFDIRDLVATAKYMERMYDAPRKRMEKRLDKATAAQKRYVAKYGYYNKGLEELQEALETDINDCTEAEAYDRLSAFLDDLLVHCNPANGGSVIKEDHFEDYIREDLRGLGVISESADDVLVIDWEATAARMRNDYSEVYYGDTAYLVRDE